MFKSNAAQNGLHLIVMLAIFGLIYAMVPERPAKAVGISLPLVTRLPTPSDPNSIQIFTSQPMAVYKTLSNIHIQENATIPAEQAQKEILTKAKNMAAKAGANGLLILQFGSGGNPKYHMSQFIFYAQAIKITGVSVPPQGGYNNAI